MAAPRLMVGAVLAATLLMTAPGDTVLPPARAVTAISLIAGRWQGRIAFTGRSYELFYLTINRDGSLVASWDGVTRYGKITLERGRARFGLFVWSGNLDYLEGGGERVLLMKEDFGAWDAIVRPRH